MTTKYGLDAQGRGLPPENFPPGREAPGDLEILRRFVNTVNFESGADRLETREGLDAWLMLLGLDVERATTPQWRRAVETRRAIRDLAAANRTKTAPNTATIDTLTAIARRRPAVVGIDPDGATTLRPADRSVDAILGWLVGVLHEARTTGTWARLKPCHNHECRWLFYDRSKNNGGTWCTMQACGQRDKARSYRRRASLRLPDRSPSRSRVT